MRQFLCLINCRNKVLHSIKHYKRKSLHEFTSMDSTVTLLYSNTSRVLTGLTQQWTVIVIIYYTATTMAILSPNLMPVVNLLSYSDIHLTSLPLFLAYNTVARGTQHFWMLMLTTLLIRINVDCFP